VLCTGGNAARDRATGATELCPRRVCDPDERLLSGDLRLRV
jgi:hypothetical protein